MTPHSPFPTSHSPPLAIVGASTRSAAASAVRAGLKPITADLFADADLRQFATATRISPYPDGFLDWLRTMEPAAWMYTGALENHPKLVDEMAWIAPLWGNPGDVLARVRSPLELAAVLHNAGLLFPETQLSASELIHDGSWLRKTYQGASGSGVRLLSTQDDLPDNESNSSLATRHSPLATFFQRRIPGTPAAAVFVAADGAATLLGHSRQLIGEEWLGAHGFQYAGSIGPLPMSERVLTTLQKIGNTLAEQFELIGLFGVDFILAEGEVWTLEVNPRYTASVEIVERITGIHAIALHAQACGATFPKASRAELVERPDPDSASRVVPDPDLALNRGRGRPGSLSHGKATLFARRDVTITPEFAEWSLAEASRTPWPTLADVSIAGTLIDAGRPVLTLFVEASTPNEVETRLRERVAEIEQKLYAQN